MAGNKELKLGIPKGSLEGMTIELFKKSGWKISSSSRSYFPTIDDSDIRCSLARPQMKSIGLEFRSSERCSWYDSK
jgi:ATP phosphoribosyltransferase